MICATLDIMAPRPADRQVLAVARLDFPQPERAYVGITRALEPGEMGWSHRLVYLDADGVIQSAAEREHHVLPGAYAHLDEGPPWYRSYGSLEERDAWPALGEIYALLAAALAEGICVRITQATAGAIRRLGHDLVSATMRAWEWQLMSARPLPQPVYEPVQRTMGRHLVMQRLGIAEEHIRDLVVVEESVEQTDAGEVWYIHAVFRADAPGLRAWAIVSGWCYTDARLEMEAHLHTAGTFAGIRDLYRQHFSDWIRPHPVYA